MVDREKDQPLPPIGDLLKMCCSSKAKQPPMYDEHEVCLVIKRGRRVSACSTLADPETIRNLWVWEPEEGKPSHMKPNVITCKSARSSAVLLSQTGNLCRSRPERPSSGSTRSSITGSDDVGLEGSPFPMESYNWEDQSKSSSDGKQRNPGNLYVPTRDYDFKSMNSSSGTSFTSAQSIDGNIN